MTGHNQHGPDGPADQCWDVEEEPCILPHRSDQALPWIQLLFICWWHTALYHPTPHCHMSIASMKLKYWCHFTFSDTIAIKRITLLWHLMPKSRLLGIFSKTWTAVPSLRSFMCTTRGATWDWFIYLLVCLFTSGTFNPPQERLSTSAITLTLDLHQQGLQWGSYSPIQVLQPLISGQH